MRQEVLSMPAKVVAQRYEVKETLGEGGMGIVYRAIDTRTNSPVAIKTLKNASDPETLAMFRKEWGELANLVHPNIVGVRDVGEFEENGVRTPFFVMPLLHGSTLAALIKASSSRLTVEHVVEILCQVCRGLNAAHEKDLIHRDLKPSNIFVMEDGTAQIIDFGLVQSTTAKTETGIVGTFQYMAPEQTEGKKVARSADIFSLGVVAYEALTGKQPFWRGGSSETIDAVRMFSPPPISEVNPKVPDLVSKAVHVAMAKQQVHRYGSAREFGDTLQKALHNQPIERFDPARIQPKITRARVAFERGDCDFASELLMELEAEGNVDPQITLLRAQVEESSKQKWIRNLFEAAQTRLEQNEIPLAIAKLSEILKIEPGNAQALSMQKAIEQQRSDQQISGWLTLVKQHLERNDFSEARQALSEVFKLRYDEPEALHLKSTIDVREKEAAKARDEKARLYSLALKASESGEISSAISTLEKILDLNRSTPGSAIPEREKVYQVFYNNMLSERDGVDNAYAESSRYLNEKNFDKALQVSDRILAKYPGNAEFKALRIRIEDAQRQDLSAYIVEVSKAVESEPSLDRRVGLLEDACKLYPTEQQFVRQLRLAREHRDLVSAILAKAKTCEEQEQFGEAIQQWKILAVTHPSYVGTAFEISQLEARRKRQITEENKGRWVQRIDQALENWAFAEALRLAKEALIEFPNDQELASQERLARQRLERVQNAERLFEEAKARRGAGNSEEVIELLQNALKLDERHFAARSMLVNLLSEQAHADLEDDSRKAEALAQTAKDLDPEHPSVKRIVSLIADKKRKDYIEDCILRARDMQSSNVHEALAILEKGLAQYPGEQRLTQLRSTLQSSIGYVEAKEKVRPAKVEKEDYIPTLIWQPNHSARDMDSLGGRGLDRTIVAIEEAPVLTEDHKLRPAEREKAERPNQPARQKPEVPPEGRTRVSKLGGSAYDPFRVFVGSLKESAQRRWVLGVILLGVVAAGVISWRVFSSPKIQVTPPPKLIVNVSVITEPGDAELRVDDVSYTERTLSLRTDKPHPVKVSHIGFQPLVTSKTTSDSWHFALTPEPMHISVVTNAPTGAVFCDGRKLGDLDEGSFKDSSLVPDGAKHTLSVTNGSGELFHVAFQALPGARPTVEPLSVPDLTVTSSLGNQGAVYSGTPAKIFISEGEAPRRVDSNGLDIDLANVGTDESEGNVQFKIARGKQSGMISVVRGNAPALSISLNAGPSLGGDVAITTPTKNAVLSVDGKQRAAERAGVWRLKMAAGAHQIKLTAPGMQDQEFPVQVKNGASTVKKVAMIALPSFATLQIRGGMPGAKVFLDQVQLIGVLDASGGLTYDKVPGGDHNVTFELEGYTPLSSRHPFKEGQTLLLPGNLKMSTLTGGVMINVSPQNAKVEYTQTGKNEWHTAQLPTQSMPPGNYEFVASASGYKQSRKTITVDAGRVGRLDFPLEVEDGPRVVITTSLLQNSPDLKQETQSKWYFSDTNALVWVQPGTQKCTIIFLPPERYNGSRHKPRRLEWEASLDGDRVSWSVENNLLTRKTKLDHGPEPNSHAVSPDGDLLYNFVLELDAHGIRIKTKDGAVIDDFRNDAHDWTHAKIGVKGNAYFDVRR
jgi:serine/threonine protein kinase